MKIFNHKNGHSRIDEKSSAKNGAVNGSGSGKNRFADFQNRFFKFTEHLRETAGRKVHFESKPFHRFQNEFRKLTKRFGESEALRKIQSKIKSSKSRAEIWFDSSFRNKVLLPVMSCAVAVLAVTYFVVRHQLAQQSEKEARKTLTTANAAFNSAQDFRRHDLLLRFHNLPNVPLWSDLFQSSAPRDLHNALRSLMEMQKVDI
ncbi:MAG TPA: hypothetical protein VE344_01785, partial [Methylomirabilota bacterium]|nr:hypothetical protein [Methylomirabilota bacterium]